MSDGRPETWRQGRGTPEYRPGGPEKVCTRKKALILDDIP